MKEFWLAFMLIWVQPLTTWIGIIHFLSHLSRLMNASLTWFISPLWVFSPFFFFAFYHCPSHKNHNLVPTPVCRVCQWIRTSDREVGHSLLPSEPLLFLFIFLFSSPPSAADAHCFACRRAIAERPKVTLMKTEGAFCLSALPSHAVHPPISPVAWLFFFPALLELCQQTPLDRDMQIFVMRKQPASWAGPSIDCETVWASVFRPRKGA